MTPWGGWLEHGICALGDSTRPATFVGSGGTNGLLISRGVGWRRVRGRGTCTRAALQAIVVVIGVQELGTRTTMEVVLIQ